MVRDESGDLGEVRDRLLNPRGSGTGRETRVEGWDESEDTRGGPGRVWGPARRSGTVRLTLGKVQNGSENPRGGLERLVGTSWRS